MLGHMVFDLTNYNIMELRLEIRTQNKKIAFETYILYIIGFFSIGFILKNDLYRHLHIYTALNERF